MKKLCWLAVIVLVGCSARLEKNLQSWVGMPVDNLVSNWGPPQSTYPLNNGGQVIEYSRSGNMTLPGVTTTTPQTTYHQGTATAYGGGRQATANYQGTSTSYVTSQGPSTNIALRCSIRFTVDSAGYITNWAWQGNNC